MKVIIRILFVLSLVWCVSRTAVYLLPGNPAEYLVHESLVQINEEVLMQKMDLNESPIKRIFSVPKNESLIKKERVTSLLGKALAKTFLLTLYALLFTLPITFVFLYFSFLKRMGKKITHSFSILFASMPLFIAGPLLLRFFDLPNPILPAITLSLYLSSFWFRALNSKLEAYLPQSSVPGGRSRGKTEFQIFTKDLLAPTLGSFFSYFGTQLGILLNGSLMVEVIFQWKGIGSLLAEAVLSRDYPVIELCLMSVTLLSLVSQQAGYLLQEYWEPKAS